MFILISVLNAGIRVISCGFVSYRKKQDCCLPYISPVQSTARSPWSLQPFHVQEGKPPVDQKLRLKCTTFPFCKDRLLTPRTLDLKERETFFPTSNIEDHPRRRGGGGGGVAGAPNNGGSALKGYQRVGKSRVNVYERVGKFIF